MGLSNILSAIPDTFQFFLGLFQKNPIKWTLIWGGVAYIIYIIFNNIF